MSEPSPQPSDQTVQQALSAAVAHYGRGALEAAEAALRAHDGAALTRGVGWNILGAIRSAQGRRQEALEAFESAARLWPEAAEPHANRGLTLIALERWAEALEALEAALARKPGDPATQANRGLALRRLGRLEEALAAMDQALALAPSDPAMVIGRADLLLELARPAEALAGYERALALRGDLPRAHNNRGVALVALEWREPALAAFEQALRLRPDYAEALTNRGLLHLEAGRSAPALADLESAVRLQPGDLRAQSGAARALDDLGRLEEAEAAFGRALALAPEDPEVLRRHGNVLRHLGRLDEALAAYARALAVNPSDPAVLFSRGTVKLLRGDLPGGFADYEARWDTADFQGKRPPLDAPLWSGEPLAGKRLLVHVEQGLGDSLQFVRFLEPLAALGGDVALLVKPALRRLLAPSLDGIALLDWPTDDDFEGDFDYQVALMSLPLRLGTTLDAIPSRVPYLAPEPERAARWRERLGPAGFTIGVCWQGNPHGRIDRGRSFPLAGLAPLAALPGVRLIALQKSHGLDQLDSLPAGMTVERPGLDFDEGPDAFLDSAAIMAGLDLVVTCDTAIAHLAGALGRPAWVALKRIPDWRWGLEGEATPWYPSLRLFRQRAQGDWESVFAPMAEALAARLGEEKETA